MGMIGTPVRTRKIAEPVKADPIVIMPPIWLPAETPELVPVKMK